MTEINWFREYHTHCFYCGRALEETAERKPNQRTLDHVVPRVKGGGRGENCVPCCFSCNIEKDSLSLEEFRAKRYGYDRWQPLCGGGMCRRFFGEILLNLANQDGINPRSIRHPEERHLKLAAFDHGQMKKALYQPSTVMAEKFRDAGLVSSKDAADFQSKLGIVATEEQ